MFIKSFIESRTGNRISFFINFKEFSMHKLRKIGNVRSCYNFCGWNITNQPFNPCIRRNNVAKGFANNFRNFFSRNGMILPLLIQRIEFSIRDYRSRIKFDFIGLKKRILINITKSFYIFFYIRAIESRHNMDRKLESILSEFM